MNKVIQGVSEIEINAEVSDVWEVMEDSQRMLKWAPMVKSTTGQKESLGSKRSCEVEWSGKISTIVEECIVLSPNKEIAFKQIEGGMTGMFNDVGVSFRLINSGNGKTTLRMENFGKPKNVLIKLMSALMMRGQMAKMRQSMLQNIKNIAEGEDLALAAPTV